MHSRLFRLLILCLCLWQTGLSATAQEKPGKPKPAPGAGKPAEKETAKGKANAEPKALEPVCLAIEPVSLRTALARALPGAKLTVMAPAREHDLGLKLLTPEEFRATGLTWPEFEAKAAAAADRLLSSLTPDIRKGADGNPSYAILKSESHLTSSILFAPGLTDRFRATFGDRLVVLMPDRFTLYVFPRSFADFQKHGKQILRQHADSVYPCSVEAFEVTGEGVRCIGSFGDGEPEENASGNPRSGDKGEAESKP